jgi:hypothetical protein
LPGQFPTAWLWFFFLSFFAIDHRGGFSLSISSLVYCWWRPQSRDPQWPRNVYIISIISPTLEKVQASQRKVRPVTVYFWSFDWESAAPFHLEHKVWQVKTLYMEWLCYWIQQDTTHT